MKFKIGDRVKVISEKCDGKMLKGQVGTIVLSKKGHFERYGVEFDNHIDGHNCEGVCKNGYGWFFRNDKLELVETIKTNDEWAHNDVKSTFRVKNTVTVILNDGSVGKSTCHPHDTFNLAEGYLLAYSRAKIESHNRSMEKYYRIEELMGGKIYE